jgi:hypothetical protein
VIAGPPMCGKSALLEEARTLLRKQNGRIVELRGSYRTRGVPYGALDGLRQESVPMAPGSPGETLPAESGGEDEPEAPVGVPIAPMGYLPDRLPRGRRSRGERARTTFLGQPVRGRSANEGDPEAYWRDLLAEFRGPGAHPVAIIIEDGALFDSESREFVVALSRKATLRPLLILCALDNTAPGFVAWEDAFLGRGDVDWVRIPEALPDARETNRLKGIFDDLPSETQRIVGLVSLLRGNVGEVVLSRVARLNYPQLAEALLPAAGVGLVRAQDGKVVIPHMAWISPIAELLPEDQVRKMHLEIAEALTALSPEPTLARRIEVARHYLAWSSGPVALRNLLEAGELSLHLVSFDNAEELFAEALTCVGSLAPSERGATESELRFLHARALFYSGRLNEAETELRDGVSAALAAGIAVEIVAEWVEPLVLAMRVVGPRPSLRTLLAELTARCHDARWTEIEILFQSLTAEFDFEGNEPDRAREESRRAAELAQSLPPGHLQAIALLAVGLARLEGVPEEQEVAGRFLEAARVLLGRARRWELDHMAAELEARLLEARGDIPPALQMRQHAIPVLQRQKLFSVELSHQLGIAADLLDRRTASGVDAALDRSRTLVDTLHLIPPSPALLRLWLLEGRRFALKDESTPARDRWEAIVESPASDSLPRLRAEALLRLALLEHSTGVPDGTTDYSTRARSPEVEAALPESWRATLGDLARFGPASQHGGAPLPVAASADRAVSEKRERSRR